MVTWSPFNILLGHRDRLTFGHQCNIVERNGTYCATMKNSDTIVILEKSHIVALLRVVSEAR
ncbi:unnamed protein product [Phytomonas sp. Hart1]|nr:unnamed protein product [Phytomonas sp. Hart1]|eukprot:CCW71845.1 unnamed protein product [Phytomonas sp. isolate Hart1]